MLKPNNITGDIYIYNNEKLNDKNYFTLDINEKRKAIDEILKEYLIHVIKKVKCFDKSLEDASILRLMEELKTGLKEEDVDMVMSSLIFYIMGLIQEIQMFAPDWRMTEEEDAIENPFLTIRGNKLYSVETHKQTDPILTFKLVYEFLQSKMDLIDYEHLGDMNDIHRLTLQGCLE